MTDPMDILLKEKSSLALLPKLNELVEGTIIEKKGGRLYVDLGPKGTGIVYGREFYAAQDIIKHFSVGDTVSAKVVELDNEEGYIELSLTEAGKEKTWLTLKELMEKGEALTLKVLEVNRGGLILEHRGVRGFMPVSQLSQKNYPRVEGGDKEKIFEELKKFVGTELTVKIITVDPREEKLIFSEKSQDIEVTKQKLAQYKVGDVIEGTVSGIVDFGAFVKFGDDLEGLVHISEIDWQLISHPADVLKAGDAVRAKIIGIEGDKVSLSLKALKEDPWAKIHEKYRKGDVVKGTVTKFNPYGAFVKLDDEIQGLIHISEFGNETRMKETIELGKTYDFKILLIDPKEHRMSLKLYTPEEQDKEKTQEKEQESKAEK